METQAVKDRLQTARFYAAIFGWKFEDQLVLSSTFQPGDVLLYVRSDDLDADLRQIQARGGTVILRDEVPGMGHIAVFSDPAGNRIALWKANTRQ